jgi:hypothetical protein
MALRVSSLSRQAVVQMLGRLNPLVLIALTTSLSRAVGSGMMHSRALAAALQVAGARRLSGLQSAAPRVRATLDKLTSRLPSVRLSLEEIAIVRAIIELYLSLIVRLSADDHRPRHGARPPSRRQCPWPHLLFIPVSRSHRTRIGVLLPLSLSML